MNTITNNNVVVIAFLVLCAIINPAYSKTHCSANNVDCQGIGESCTINSTLIINNDQTLEESLECLPEGSKCCRVGLYCIEGTCESDNQGGSCSTTNDCFQSLFGLESTCINNKCQALGNENDDCKSDSECFGSMKCDGRCVGLKEGDVCTPNFFQTDCGFLLFCDTIGNQSLCKPRILQGQPCSANGTPCIQGGFCSNTNTCLLEFSQGVGSSCAEDADSCQSGTTCNEDSNTCETVVELITKCSSNKDCPNQENCTCAPGIGEGVCQNNNYDPCRKGEKSYSQCLITNHCYSGYQKGTCAYTFCSKEWDNFMACICETSRETYGGGCNFYTCKTS